MAKKKNAALEREQWAKIHAMLVQHRSKNRHKTLTSQHESEEVKSKNKKKKVVLKSNNPEINVVKTIEGTLKSVTHYKGTSKVSLFIKTELFSNSCADIMVLKEQITKIPPRGAKVVITYFLGLRECSGECVESYFLKKLSWKGEDIISLPEGKEDWIAEW